MKVIKRNVNIVVIATLIVVVLLTTAIAIKEEIGKNLFSNIEVYTSGKVEDLVYLQTGNVFDIAVKDAHHLTLTIKETNGFGQVVIYDGTKSDHGIVVKKNGIVGEPFSEMEVRAFGNDSELKCLQFANLFNVDAEAVNRVALTAGDSTLIGSIRICDSAYQDIILNISNN